MISSHNTLFAYWWSGILEMINKLLSLWITLIAKTAPWTFASCKMFLTFQSKLKSFGLLINDRFEDPPLGLVDPNEKWRDNARSETRLKNDEMINGEESECESELREAKQRHHGRTMTAGNTAADSRSNYRHLFLLMNRDRWDASARRSDWDAEGN